MRGYEVVISNGHAITPKLRIPMRGYEMSIEWGYKKRLNVTNPHAGL